MNRVPSSIVRGVALAAAAAALASQPVLAAPGLGTTVGIKPKITPAPKIDVTPVVGAFRPIEYSPKLLDMGELRSYRSDQRTVKLTLTSPNDGDMTAKLSPAGPFQVTRLIGVRRTLDPTTGRWRNQTAPGGGTLSLIKDQKVEVEVTLKATAGMDAAPRANLEVYGRGWYLEVPVRAFVTHEPEIIAEPQSQLKIAPGGEADVPIKLNRTRGASFTGPSGVSRDVTLTAQALPAGVTMDPVTVRVPVEEFEVMATAHFHAAPGAAVGWNQPAVVSVDSGIDQDAVDVGAQVYPASRSWNYDQQIGDVNHKGTLTINSDGTWYWKAHLEDDGTFFGDTYIVSVWLNVPIGAEGTEARPTTFAIGSLGGGVFGGSTEADIDRNHTNDRYNTPGPNLWLRDHYIEAFDAGLTIRGQSDWDLGPMTAAFVEWGWGKIGIDLDLD